MDRYIFLEELGDGTCGSVYKAINKETWEIVAVKKMKRKFYDWEECINLREVKSLRKLNHPKIIKLREIVRENNDLFFIFEYMERNLYQIMRERQRPFSEEEIRSLMSQVLHGLSYMHRNGYFHRDLKPENLLVTEDVTKIADFGLAREVSSEPPFTDYVSTRWYRAPEVLLQSTSYTPAIAHSVLVSWEFLVILDSWMCKRENVADMWAIGAILAELFTSCPIFPGESEIDQLYKICCVLGRPDWSAFPEARNISHLLEINYFEITPANLSDIVPNASLEALDLIKQLFSWDPTKRPTADQCLQHPFFHVDLWIPRPPADPLQLTLSNFGSKPNLELNLWDFGSQSDDCFLGLSLAVNPSVSNFDLFPAEMVHKTQCKKEDLVLCSGFQDDSKQSAFWSLPPTEDHRISPPVESSLSLSFSTISSASNGIPESAGFAIASLQSNILDRPLLAMPSPFQQGR